MIRALPALLLLAACSSAGRALCDASRDCAKESDSPWTSDEMQACVSDAEEQEAKVPESCMDEFDAYNDCILDNGQCQDGAWVLDAGDWSLCSGAIDALGAC